MKFNPAVYWPLQHELCLPGGAVELEKRFEGFAIPTMIITFLDFSIKRDHFIIQSHCLYKTIVFPLNLPSRTVATDYLAITFWDCRQS